MKRFSVYSIPLLFLVLSLNTSLSRPAAAGGGSEAGNGGGLAEKNVTFADLNLGTYLDLCLGTPLCSLTGGEQELLAKIRAALGQEKQNPAQLVFDSEKKHPGFFMIDGQVRVAKTGDQVGGAIYVNTDLLYAETAPHVFQAIQIPMAISILVHELGHHQGVSDHATLDVLGSKVQALAMIQQQRSEFWNGSAALVTLQLNLVKRDEDKKNIRLIDTMMLEYGDDLIGLTAQVLQGLHCPVASDSVRGLRLYNVHEERGVSFDQATQLIRKPIQAWYILSCADGQESDHGNIEIGLMFKKASTPLFMKELTQVKQVSCHSDATACK